MTTKRSGKPEHVQYGPEKEARIYAIRSEITSARSEIKALEIRIQGLVQELDELARPAAGKFNTTGEVVLRDVEVKNSDCPPGWHPEPLQGSKKDLARWIFPSSPDPRRLDTAVTNGQLHLREDGRYAFSAFFPTARRYAEANARRIASRDAANNGEQQ